MGKHVKPFATPTWHRWKMYWKPNVEYYDNAKSIEEYNNEMDRILPTFRTEPEKHLLGCLMNYTAEKHRVYAGLGQFNRRGRVDAEFKDEDWANIDAPKPSLVH